MNGTELHCGKSTLENINCSTFDMYYYILKSQYRSYVFQCGFIYIWLARLSIKFVTCYILPSVSYPWLHAGYFQ
jgi:hypothetical protein